MRYYFIAAFIILSVNCSAQQQQRWLQDLESPEFESEELQIGNELEKYAEFDFSELLIPRHAFLGFIGSNYKRIFISFSSVRRNHNSNVLYDVIGTSITGNNRCNFEGTIKLKQARLFKHMHYGVDDELKNEGMKAQGVLIGEYELMEDRKQPHSGIFSGIFTTYWYVDRNNKIHYDEIESFSDRYRNNQFVGTWTEYKTKSTKICNWGDRRIPFSGDLDIGTAEFFPNPKYSKMGWSNYKEN